jgi:23S rRNA (cytosine1962-C5)-methyltransferase
MHVTTLEKAISDAWERKHSLWEKTGAIRLLNAQASGAPRIVFELYGKHAVLFDYGAVGNVDSGLEGNTEAWWIESLRMRAPRWMETFGFESVSRLDRTRAGDSGRSGNHALAGDPPESITIREHSLSFRLEPRHPRNVGLFLDTRALRRNLSENVSGARVLNLFCYTGSLGLAALSGGAEEVVQVDVSARYLQWGRENLRLNALPESRCRFTHMDSERYLDWAAKKGLRFDHIILDPPVFSRFEGRVFRFADDYFRLAVKCGERLSPGGTLHAVTNYSGVRPAAFAAELARAFRDAGLESLAPRRVPLPADYDLAEDAEDLPEGNAMIFNVTRQ